MTIGLKAMILELAKGKIKPGVSYRNQQNLTFFDLFS